MSCKPICLITGVGDATGSALVKKFANQGYTVAMVARTQSRLNQLEQTVPSSHGYVCDIADFEQLKKVLMQIKYELGVVKVLVHNAVSHTFGRFMDTAVSDMEKNFRVNTTSLLYLCQQLAPDMVALKSGSIIVTGNTASLRGVPQYALFAPTKAAQRILCESLARDLGPQKVHVGYVTIDGAINVNWIKETDGKVPDWLIPPSDWPWPKESFYVAPKAIADEVFHMAHQHESAWSFETTIRPFAEHW
jgi:short-subunit dehydrogenase